MIEKSIEHSPKTNLQKPPEETEFGVPTFKLLYRNMPNSERDKSSDDNSDEETTSSSLIPIPETLRQMRNKLKRSVTTAENSGDACDVPEVLEKSPVIVTSSLEELRKKYTLKNETSVALKMNSANLILDDILNSATLNNNPKENIPVRYFKQQEIQTKTVSENETSTTESSVSVPKHFPHLMAHAHPIAYDFFQPLCARHGSYAESLQDPIEKDSFVPHKPLDNQKKRTLLEKLQDLQLKCKIQSVYRSFQKTRNPFAKVRKEPEIVKFQQGIPIVGSENESVLKCNCLPKYNSKRLSLDVIGSSELSQSETRSAEFNAHHCTCINRRECDCPEVIPRCNCVLMHSEVTSELPKPSSPHSENPGLNKDYVHETQEAKVTSQKKDESSPLFPDNNENDQDIKKKKMNSLKRHFQESKKLCSQERRIIERTDIYYFDHGNSAYYRTTDNHPMRYTECLVERTDHYATKFWAEFFGTIEIGIAFLISFFLQFYRFLFTSIIRSLTVGLLQIFSDYFFKPLLTIMFNGLIQPCLILAYNIATSVRDLCLPISQIFGFFAKEVAGIIRSCRLVEYNHDKHISCNCGNKV